MVRVVRRFKIGEERAARSGGTSFTVPEGVGVDEVFLRGVLVRRDVVAIDPKTGKEVRVRNVTGGIPTREEILRSGRPGPAELTPQREAQLQAEITRAEERERRAPAKKVSVSEQQRKAAEATARRVAKLSGKGTPGPLTRVERSKGKVTFIFQNARVVLPEGGLTFDKTPRSIIIRDERTGKRRVFTAEQFKEEIPKVQQKEFERLITGTLEKQERARVAREQRRQLEAAKAQQKAAEQLSPEFRAGVVERAGRELETQIKEGTLTVPEKETFLPPLDLGLTRKPPSGGTISTERPGKPLTFTDFTRQEIAQEESFFKRAEIALSSLEFKGQELELKGSKVIAPLLIAGGTAVSIPTQLGKTLVTRGPVAAFESAVFGTAEFIVRPQTALTAPTPTGRAAQLAGIFIGGEAIGAGAKVSFKATRASIAISKATGRAVVGKAPIATPGLPKFAQKIRTRQAIKRFDKATKKGGEFEFSRKGVEQFARVDPKTGKITFFQQLTKPEGLTPLKISVRKTGAPVTSAAEALTLVKKGIKLDVRPAPGIQTRLKQAAPLKKIKDVKVSDIQRQFTRETVTFDVGRAQQLNIPVKGPGGITIKQAVVTTVKPVKVTFDLTAPKVLPPKLPTSAAGFGELFKKAPTRQTALFEARGLKGIPAKSIISKKGQLGFREFFGFTDPLSAAVVSAKTTVSGLKLTSISKTRLSVPSGVGLKTPARGPFVIVPQREQFKPGIREGFIEITRPEEEEDIKTVVVQIPKIDERIEPGTDQFLEQRLDTKPREKIDISDITGPRERAREEVREETEPRIITVPEIDDIITPETPTTPEKKTPTTTTPRIPLLPLVSEDPKKKRKTALFDVFAKERGSFVKVNTSRLPKNKALNLGATVVDQTTSAQFKLKSSGTSKKRIEDDFLFILRRKFTKKNSNYIEKNAHRIDSIGELRGITVKGHQANRARARGFF